MIQINDKYAIGSDANQWMILKFVKAGSDPTKYPARWEPDGGYHREMKGTVKSLANRLLRTSEYSSIATLETRCGEIVEMFNIAMGDIKTPEIAVEQSND